MNIERLPKIEHKKVIEMVEKFDYKGLLLIHNKYKLTDWNYDCCGEEFLYEHFKDAVNTGKIKAD